jgi:hypothetical protein
MECLYIVISVAGVSVTADGMSLHCY